MWEYLKAVLCGLVGHGGVCMVTPLTGFCKRCGTNLNLIPKAAIDATIEQGKGE